jgi:hypothetical protein
MAYFLLGGGCGVDLGYSQRQCNRNPRIWRPGSRRGECCGAFINSHAAGPSDTGCDIAAVSWLRALRIPINLHRRHEQAEWDSPPAERKAGHHRLVSMLAPAVGAASVRCASPSGQHQGRPHPVGAVRAHRRSLPAFRTYTDMRRRDGGPRLLRRCLGRCLRHANLPSRLKTPRPHGNKLRFPK